MNRKIFSQKFIKSIIGIASLSAVPFLSLKSKNSKNNNTLKVKINPSAVRREKPGGKNV